MYVRSTYFNTESGFDRIQIGGVSYSGTSGPQNAYMSSGA